MNQEIDLKGAQVDGEAKIIHHFTKDLEECKLDYERPCEKWAAELHEVHEQLEILKERESRLKAVAKNLKDRGVFTYGGYVLTVSEKAGARTLDKDALIKRLTAELGEAEAQVYINESMKTGKPSVSISVDKISGGVDSGGSGVEGGL